MFGREFVGAPSPWVSRFDEASLAGEAARCPRQLRGLDPARQQAERVVALRSENRARSRAFGRVTLATILVEQGELDSACAIGYQAVDGTRAVGSFLVVQQPHTLRKLLEPYRSVSPHGPWDDLLMFVFDGGVLDTGQTSSLRLLDDELSAFRFFTEEEAATLLRPYV